MAPAPTSTNLITAPAGVATAITITGTGFASAALSATGCVFGSVVTVSATSITATITPAEGLRGTAPTITVTNGDTTTGTITGPSIRPGDVNSVQTGVLVPPASGSRAIDQATETNFAAGNPACKGLAPQSAGLVTLPEPGASSGTGTKNVSAEMNRRNQETDMRGEGLGDYVAAGRPSALAANTV